MCHRTCSFVLMFSLVLLGFPASHGASLRCYYDSLQNYFVTPLEEPLAILNTTCIDFKLATLFYAFGYKGEARGYATTGVLEAYLAKKNRNIVLLDWGEEAKSGALGTSLSYAFYAAPNAKKIGTKLGDALVRLSQAGMDMMSFHLMGHSLGAQLMGHAGRRVQQDGYTVPRITGLDPARILFEGALKVQEGLDRNSAKYVDIVHSDPGGYGIEFSSGTADFWPNYVGSNSTQPGCPVGVFEKFSRDDLCSHDRSWTFLAESIASPTAFPARGAVDYEDWLTSSKATKTVYMGDLTDTSAVGNFYLTTNPSPPYGRGQAGLKPNEK